jgi:predicted metal-dependent phosphoesterase TrpH
LSVDLHSHTTISDGVLAPRDLVRAAARAGITVLSVTDHDTVEAVSESIDEAAHHGIRVIPGVEISSFVADPTEPDPEKAERNLHVLAYFAPASLPLLFDWQAERRRARDERLDHMLARLRDLGMPLTREEVLGRAPDPRRSFGRPHIARALVARGFAADTRDAFNRILGQGCPAYVDYPRPDAPEVCALVRRLRGVAVVAHPGLDFLDPCLEHLREYGVRGLEVFHPDHAPDATARFLARARELDLLPTGGSDYHGGQKNEGGALGATSLPEDHWERLDEALLAASQGK